MTGGTVVVGVAGGIAAYKSVALVRTLVLEGYDVHVIPTEASLQFVGLATWEAISRNPVTTSIFVGVAEVRHVALGQRADLVVIAPATANTLAKLAGGIADDLLGTTVLASRAPLLVAPAMHTEMWENAATRANVETLRARGVEFVGPESGQLTGSDSGIGRMAEADQIATAVRSLLETPGSPRAAAPRVDPPGGDTVTLDVELDLLGRRILITAGGTREPLDPVRFLGNRSSGKQGVALAEAARARGAEVVLIAAHLEVPAPEGVRIRPVATAAELLDAALAEAPAADVVIMAAAVADYRPIDVAPGKLKKEDVGDRLEVVFEKTADVLRELVAQRDAQKSSRVVVGFAAETEPDTAALLELGRAKRARKGCDFLVLNRVGWDEGFGVDRNEVVIIDEAGDIVGESSGSKTSVAHGILDAVRPS